MAGSIRGRMARFLLAKRQCHFSRPTEIMRGESHGFLHGSMEETGQRGCPDVKISVGIRQSLMLV